MNRRDVLAGLGLAAAAARKGQAAILPPATGMAVKQRKVEGCVALVTGSNRGGGKGFVEVLLARGAKRVYATARRPETLPPIVALDPSRVVPLQLDITSDTQRRAAAAAARDLTWLINNAAITGSTHDAERRFRAASTLDDAKLVMDTNCWSAAELARLFIPTIIANGGGAIVNILSVGALYNFPEFSSYSVSKAAAASVTAGLRAELDRDPILVCGVFTGGINSRPAITGGVSPQEHANEVIDAMAEGQTSIYAGKGAAALRDRIRADPEAFERFAIDRFYNNPIRLPPE